MELKEEKTDNCSIVSISGRLDTTTYGMLEKMLNEMIDRPQGKILLECSEMDYVSSSGLRVFLMALKKISQMKGRFIICGLQENIREIFEISGFTKVFDIYNTAGEAIVQF